MTRNSDMSMRTEDFIKTLALALVTIAIVAAEVVK